MYECKNRKFFVISQIFQKITKSDLKNYAIDVKLGKSFYVDDILRDYGIIFSQNRSSYLQCLPKM